MRLDKLTIKAQEALQKAQALAQKHSHQRLEPEHLLLALLDPVYGARPLRRAVQKYLMDPLAMRLLDGSLKAGETVTVDQNGSDALLFSGAS